MHLKQNLIGCDRYSELPACGDGWRGRQNPIRSTGFHSTVWKCQPDVQWIVSSIIVQILKNNDRGKLYPLLYDYLVFSHLFDLVCFQPDLHSMQRLCRSGVPQHHNVWEPDRPRNPPSQLHRRHHYQHSVHQWSTHPIRCIQWKTAAQGRYHRANSGGYSIHMVLFGHNKSIVLNSNLYIKHGFIYPANEIKTSCIINFFKFYKKEKSRLP